jgi:hypothetical protein
MSSNKRALTSHDTHKPIAMDFQADYKRARVSIRDSHRDCCTTHAPPGVHGCAESTVVAATTVTVAIQFANFSIPGVFMAPPCFQNGYRTAVVMSRPVGARGCTPRSPETCCGGSEDCFLIHPGSKHAPRRTCACSCKELHRFITKGAVASAKCIFSVPAAAIIDR